jgi:hypothetical protein
MNIFKREKQNLADKRNEQKLEKACKKEQIMQFYERSIDDECAYKDYLYLYHYHAGSFVSRYWPC